MDERKANVLSPANTMMTATNMTVSVVGVVVRVVVCSG